MYIAGQGQTTPGYKISMSIETACHFGHFTAGFKRISLKSDFRQFFMILYMYIAPGQGLTTLWGRNFDVNRNILSPRSFVASFKKKISLKAEFIHFFSMILYIYIAPGQGQTAPRGQSFYVNKNVLSLYLFVASFKEKKCLWSLTLYIFSWFNTYI